MLLLICVGLGCGTDEPLNSNLAPSILTFEAASDIVLPGTEVSIHLIAGDLENDPLSYTGRYRGRTHGESVRRALARARNRTEIQIKVTVSDGEHSTTSTLEIQVWRTRPGNYYPLAVGNTWHYSDENGNKITFEIIDTIQIQRAGGEPIESFVLQKSSTDASLKNIVNYSYLGPLLDETGEVSAIVQHAQNTTSGTGDTILFEPFLPLYQFPLIPGDKWHINFQAKLVPELFHWVLD